MVSTVTNNLSWLAGITRSRWNSHSRPTASAASTRPSPVDVIAADSLRASLAALQAESSANQRAAQLTQTADGALTEISGMLAEVRGLVAANADSGTSPDEKAANQLQIDAVLASVDRLAGSTSFAGIKLLDGTASITASGATLQISSASTDALGSIESAGQTYTLKDLKTGGTLAPGGELAAQVIDSAINSVATSRASLGAFEKHQLNSRLETLADAREQILSSQARFDDVAQTMQSIRAAMLAGANRSLVETQRGTLLDLLA